MVEAVVGAEDTVEIAVMTGTEGVTVIAGDDLTPGTDIAGTW